MTKRDDVYHHDNVFPITMGRESKLKEVLEKLSEDDDELLLFDGEDFWEIEEVITDTADGSNEFLDLSVKYDEFGIYDFFVQSEMPIFSFARRCKACDKLVKVISRESSKKEDFCGCPK